MNVLLRKYKVMVIHSSMMDESIKKSRIIVVYDNRRQMKAKAIKHTSSFCMILSF